MFAEYLKNWPGIVCIIRLVKLSTQNLCLGFDFVDLLAMSTTAS